MKKSIQLGLMSVLVSTIVSAMEEQSQWTENFSTNVGIISHTPKTVSLGGMMTSGKQIVLNSKIFNGVPMKAPLSIKVNSSREEFIRAIEDAGITLLKN